MMPARNGAVAIDHVDEKPCLASRLSRRFTCPGTDRASSRRTFRAPAGGDPRAGQRPVSEHILDWLTGGTSKLRMRFLAASALIARPHCSAYPAGSGPTTTH